MKRVKGQGSTVKRQQARVISQRPRVPPSLCPPCPLIPTDHSAVLVDFVDPI